MEIEKGFFDWEDDRGNSIAILHSDIVNTEEIDPEQHKENLKRLKELKEIKPDTENDFIFED